MRTWNTFRLRQSIAQLALLTAVAGAAAAQPYIDGDDPGASAEAGAESTASGNPLDSGDRVYSLRLSFRRPSGRWGFEGLLGVAEPTSPFARAAGPDADLYLLDLSVVRYLNYPPRIDRDCGGRHAGPGEVQPWHCGRRIKPEYLVFGGPGAAFLEVDDAFPGSPLPDASKSFFTLNAGFAVKIYWLRDTPSELAPGLEYDARRTSRWYLRPEIRARWFDGGSGDVDWGVGVALGRGFGRGDTHGALCLQIEEACHLSRRVLDSVESAAGTAQPSGDALFEALEKRREQLQEYRARALAAGVECGTCLDDGIKALNGGLDQLR